MDQEQYTEDELVEFRNELRKYKEIGNNKVMNIVKRLMSAKILVSQLQSTKIAQTIQTLSTLPSFDETDDGKDIKKFCAQLINKWKKIVADEKAKQSSNSQPKPQLTKQSSNPSQTLPRRQSSGQGQVETVLANEDPVYKTENKTDLPTYKSEIRQKGLNAIYNNFQKVRDDISVALEEWISVIVTLEKRIYCRSPNVVNYKAHIREVLGMFTSNDILLEVISKLLNKEISFQDVAEAKTAVFLTEAKKAEIKKSEEDMLAINDPEFYNNMRRQRLQNCEGELCKSCKQKTAFLVKELQTRSSDEPMTRFMQCNTCGKSWRD